MFYNFLAQVIDALLYHTCPPGRFLIQVQTEFLILRAEGALRTRKSRISAAGRRLQKSTPSSLIVPLAFLTMVCPPCSAPMHLQNEHLLPLSSTMKHSFAMGVLHSQHLVFPP